MQFEFYVLNYDYNKQEVEMFNIFSNIHVQEWTEKTIRKYLRNPKRFRYEPYGDDTEVVHGFEGLVKEIDGIIRWQEWSRSEYECSAGHAFENDCKKLKKIDCYYQTRPNMEIIVHTVLRQYKEQIKKERE